MEVGSATPISLYLSAFDLSAFLSAPSQGTATNRIALVIQLRVWQTYSD
jgi:hypothetical protein